jgi:hypothetical protein
MWRRYLNCAFALLLAASELHGTVAVSRPVHFVFFGYDHDRIQERDFLETPAIAGAQLKYSWRELEPAKGEYDLEGLRRDLVFLRRHAKRLFLQVQDVSFSESDVPVPDYLVEEPAYSGGVAQKFLTVGPDVRSDGWVARRWDPAVRGRFNLLLARIAGEFDGELEGVNLAETSIDFGGDGELSPPGFTPEAYAAAIQEQMTVLGALFQNSSVLQYANFMPGEWLPWIDKGLLRRIYDHAFKNGVGVGGPDLLPHRRGQQNHSLPLIAGRPDGVVAGLAVQDGNLSEKNPVTGELVSPQELEAFARKQLRLEYIFWGTEEPHYSNRVVPFLRSLPQEASPAASRPANNGAAADRLFSRPRGASERVTEVAASDRDLRAAADRRGR